MNLKEGTCRITFFAIHSIYSYNPIIINSIKIKFNLYSECLTKEALDGLGDFNNSCVTYKNS